MVNSHQPEWTGDRAGVSATIHANVLLCSAALTLEKDAPVTTSLEVQFSSLVPGFSPGEFQKARPPSTLVNAPPPNACYLGGDAAEQGYLVEAMHGY